MIVKLPDGRVMQGPWHSLVTGFVASSIEIEAADVTSMRKMLERHPSRLYSLLAQLESRFEANRLPHVTRG